MRADIEHPEAYANATRACIIANAKITFHRTVDDSHAIVDFLGDNQWSDFARSLFFAYESYGKLSEKQCAAARSMMAKATERAAAKAVERAADHARLVATSGHVGEVGKPLTMALTVRKIIRIDFTPQFYGDSGVTYIHLCSDADGNAIVYKGCADMPGEGETRRMTVTVKAHTEREGVAQTLVSRPRAPKAEKAKKAAAV